MLFRSTHRTCFFNREPCHAMNLVSVPLPTELPAGTLAERVYAQIKQLIFDFVLLPGDRFSESELANRVQVSRTPLRQALQRLQREGFLLVFPKSGWQVAPLDFETFDQLNGLIVGASVGAGGVRQPVLLSQVGTISVAEVHTSGWSETNGRPGLSVSVSKSEIGRAHV